MLVEPQPKTLLQIFLKCMPYLKVMLKSVRNPYNTFQNAHLSSTFNHRIFYKTFEAKMLVETQTKTLLQIFFKCMAYSRVTLKIVCKPDDIFQNAHLFSILALAVWMVVCPLGLTCGDLSSWEECAAMFDINDLENRK